MTSQTNKEEVHDIVNNVIRECIKLIPGATEDEQRNWCVKRVTNILETFDNAIPVIGVLLDNPIVDDWEQQAIMLLVKWAWDRRPKELMVD